MTFTRKMTGVALTFTAILLGALLMSGCGQHNPVAPVTTNGGGEDIKHGGQDNFAAGGITAGLDSTVVLTQGLVSAKFGGIVKLGMAGKIHVLAVAPNSVASDVIIKVKTSTFKKGDKKIVTFDFGPDGQKFLPSAKMTIDASVLGQVTPASVNLYWFNPATKQWVLQQTQAPRLGVVAFDIYHFSKYGIS
ncbi:MAG: hypothetical protein HZB43_07225 [candidate division Zixibacteria bacterium]|nr:hypothetical protein [candidate division Zixibacteria bacterium]